MRIRWLDRYQAWLRESRTYMKWLDGWALVIVIGMPLAGGWVLMHVILSWVRIGESPLLVWILVWAFLAPPLYFAATALLRLAAGLLDVRTRTKNSRPG
jgi:predicted ABC-type exoprotein transport system permease subunit